MMCDLFFLLNGCFFKTESVFIEFIVRLGETECDLLFEELSLVYFKFPNSMSNGIGDSGASSLSEALKINSSLTHLDLGVCL